MKILNAQVLDDPLHDTEVVHHLYKGNEEDDSTQNDGKEPVLVGDGILIEEENSTNCGLLQEVGCKESDPFEDFESSAGFKDEEGDGLLEEQTDNDRGPGRPKLEIIPSAERSELPIGNTPTMGLWSGF